MHKTELEYKQCVNYYEDIIEDLKKKYESKIWDLEYELRKLK